MPLWGSSGAGPIGAQVIDGLRVHAEIRGEFACHQYRLKAELEESLSVHNPQKLEVTTSHSNWIVHLLYERPKHAGLVE